MSDKRYIGRVKTSSARDKLRALPFEDANRFHAMRIVDATSLSEAEERFTAYYWDRFGLILEPGDYILEPEIQHGIQA